MNATIKPHKRCLGTRVAETLLSLTCIIAVTMIIGCSANIGYAQTAEALAKKAGCFECHNVKDQHVGPAFKDIAARYHVDPREYELRFISVASAQDLPNQRASTVIVARVGDDLRIRIFDSGGTKVVDKPAEQLADAKQLASLKERLQGDSVPDGSQMAPDERRKILETVLSIAGFSADDVRASLIETVRIGGKGHWTAVSKGVPMPPFGGRLTEEEIGRLVDWILRRGDGFDLSVMKTGLGSGRVTSNPPGIDCDGDCEQLFGLGTEVTLTATPDPGSVFKRWVLEPEVTTTTLTVTMDTHYSARAEFELATPIPPLNPADINPTGIEAYLAANPLVSSSSRFLNALPRDYKQNWILMSRSESLQTGTATYPRILVPSADAQNVFTVGAAVHSSYPGAHPNAIEYMQWDGAEKNFRFHEIIVADIPAMHPAKQPDGSIKDTFPARIRGISIDDNKCSKCHSTQNVLNRSTFPGTTGVSPPFTIKPKNKPNWDTYDSWGGMLPLNRDRIYKGSVEAAAFRTIFNPWTWRTNPSVRSIFEQLELQPTGVPDGTGGTRDHRITQLKGGEHDGHIRFGFDPATPVMTEPEPEGDAATNLSTNYGFDAKPGTGPNSTVKRKDEFAPDYVTLHHSLSPRNDEGRGVQLFDTLGGLDGDFNAQRIADELIDHRFATGSGPIDIRPVALAIASELLEIDEAANAIRTKSGLPPLAISVSFFDLRNGMFIKQLRADTEARARSIPRRKADIQKINLDRSGDVYLRLFDSTPGLIKEYGAKTYYGEDTDIPRLRQEVFRRHPNGFYVDSDGVMGGIYVDRELYSYNTPRIAMFRYFLEPLGVSVDKWSMGVRGRSRTYTFADVFGTYINVFEPKLRESLQNDPRSTGLSGSFTDEELIDAVNRTLSLLPDADEVPRFTNIQRIFNRSCIECHGGLNYPPYFDFVDSDSPFFRGYIDFSEDEYPPAASNRLDRSHGWASRFTNGTTTSQLYSIITKPDEDCSYTGVEMMPCGGPSLSKVDIETIRRWILGGSPYSVGDPHIKTVDGTRYDFQAAGEFVALRGENLEVQVRQFAVGTDGPLGPNAHSGLSSGVSVNTAVAVRVGQTRITYQPRPGNNPRVDGMQLRIDGKSIDLNPEGIPYAPGARITTTMADGGIQIETLGSTAIIVTPGFWEHYQLWYLHIDTRHVRAAEGLMGVISPGNWLPALPDGEFMGPRPDDLRQRHRDLYEKFGNAWRVTDASSLFDYESGTSTASFSLSDWPGSDAADGFIPPEGEGGTGRKAVLKRLTLEEAEQLSAEIRDADLRDHCIQDVMVTGEKGIVQTYLLTDRIRRNSPPTTPVLVSPADQSRDLQTKVTFTWMPSTDPDGDTVTYRFFLGPIEAPPNHNDAVLVTTAEARQFSKTVSGLETGKSYNWKVIADDGKGRTTESQSRRIKVK